MLLIVWFGQNDKQVATGERRGHRRLLAGKSHFNVVGKCLDWFVSFDVAWTTDVGLATAVCLSCHGDATPRCYWRRCWRCWRWRRCGFPLFSFSSTVVFSFFSFYFLVKFFARSQGRGWLVSSPVLLTDDWYRWSAAAAAIDARRRGDLRRFSSQLKPTVHLFLFNLPLWSKVPQPESKLDITTCDCEISLLIILLFSDHCHPRCPPAKYPIKASQQNISPLTPTISQYVYSQRVRHLIFPLDNA